jgi:hypothetical protein
MRRARSPVILLSFAIDEGRTLAMTQDLAYDMMFEVQGLIRSFAVRARVDHELRVGETFRLRGRRWIVSNVRHADREGLDRRLIAREVDTDDAPRLAARLGA